MIHYSLLVFMQSELPVSYKKIFFPRALTSVTHVLQQREQKNYTRFISNQEKSIPPNVHLKNSHRRIMHCNLATFLSAQTKKYTFLHGISSRRRKRSISILNFVKVNQLSKARARAAACNDIRVQRGQKRVRAR